MINKDIIQLCDIVKTALRNELYVESIHNPTELTKLAKENGLSGLIYPSLNHDKAPESLRKTLQKEHYIYIAQSTKQDALLQDIAIIFEQNDISYILLKGATLRHLYLEPYMRSMGDVDILVHAEDMEKIHTLLNQAKYENIYNSHAHDGFRHLNGCVIEVHPHITHPIKNHDNTLFNDSWNYVKNNHELQPEYELTYLLYHTVKHLLSSGIGLRTLLDIGIYVKHYKNEINIDTLNDMLKQTNLTTFAHRIMLLQQHYFELPNLFDNKDEKPLTDNFIQLMTKYIAISGVHGTGDEFNKMIPRLANTSKRFPRFRLFYRVLFPKVSTMKEHYPIVQKSIIFYPIGWILRVFRLLFTSRKSTIHKIHQTSIPKDQIKRINLMFEELGL